MTVGGTVPVPKNPSYDALTFAPIPAHRVAFASARRRPNKHLIVG